MRSLSVAVVGSGPSGCYAAQALRKQFPEAEITVIERLPVPFGLLRYGVAPDHQGTKSVQNQFENLFARQNVGFVGGIDIGADITEAKLREAFDIVVLATGVPNDRLLAVPGDKLPGVVGAGRLTRALNSHPGEQSCLPLVGKKVAVIGSGNVAVDVVRLLCKRGRTDWSGSDMDDDILFAIVPAQVREIHLLCRSSPEKTRWDAAMVSELSGLSGTVFRLGRGEITDPSVKAAEAVANLVSNPTSAEDNDIDVFFHFGIEIEKIVGDGKVEGICISAADRVAMLDVDTVVTAIGFAWQAKPLDDRTYATGWLRTGPRGTIPSQRTLSRELVAEIVADLEAGRIDTGRPGKSGLDLKDSTGFAGWGRVKEREFSTASPGRVRRKICSNAELLSLARGG